MSGKYLMYIHRKLIQMLLILVSVLISYPAKSGDLDSDQKTSAVVKIITESSSPDYIHPWQVGSIESYTGSGVIIEIIKYKQHLT
jgi:hypothetical protein